MSKFRFIDLFAGIGGMRWPFEEIGGRCIFTSEWNKFSQETYQANFPEFNNVSDFWKGATNHKFVGDIRPFAENPESIPPHDVLLAGFPCQPFSIAGITKRNSLGRPHGFDCDVQGTAFHDLAKIIDHHRPAAFLFENVKGLVHHDGGRTFSIIMHVLEEELAYSVTTRVLSSYPWVPQKRERIFIVGFRGPTNFNFDALAVPDQKPTLKDILDRDVDLKYTITEHMWETCKKQAEKDTGFSYAVNGPDDIARTLTARYLSMMGGTILIRQENNLPRRLTPRECSRLMGFDKSGGSEFIIPVSDNQAYRQFGNAVVPPLVRSIADLMKPYILDLMKNKPKSHIVRLCSNNGKTILNGPVMIPVSDWKQRAELRRSV